MKIKPVYIVLSVLFCISLLVLGLFGQNKISNIILSIPIAGIMIGGIFNFLRDELIHERQLSLQKEQNYYTLSISSHMANVAFNKHVDFCEKYAAKIRKFLVDIFVEEPSIKIADYSDQLKQIRIDYCLWVTPEIVDNLLPFELNLLVLGIDSHNILTLKDTSASSAERLKIYADKRKILGLEKDEKLGVENVETIISKLQKILGINELTKLRQKVLSEAMKTLNS